MKRLMRKLKSGLALMGLLISSIANSDVERIATSIQQVVVDDTRWGQCIALIDVDLSQSSNLACDLNWVTFACDGAFAPQAVASQKYDAALLAFALQKQVTLDIDDARQINGACYAMRIDMLESSL